MIRIIAAIIRREYFVRVRKPSFVIGTLLAPLIFLGMITIPVFLLTVGGGERRVTVLDQSGDASLFETIQSTLSRKQDAGTKFRLEREVVPQDRDVDAVRSEHNFELSQDGNRAYIVLRCGVLEGAAPEYYASNTTDVSIATLGQAIGSGITRRRLAIAGLDESRVDQYTNQAELKTVRVTSRGEAEESGQSLIASISIFVAIFFTVFAQSASVMGGVVEEKESRIIEVLMTTVEPYQVMTGKLVGIGLVGLTQYGIWGACGLLIGGAAKLFSDAPALHLSRMGPVLFYFPIFYLLGYFLYGGLYLIAAAPASNAEEAGQFARPITLVTITQGLLIWIVIKDPNGAIAVALSMVPFFTPTTMMMRIAVGSTPAWQILLSMFLMLGCIVVTLWAAAKTYRVGILMYGKKLTFSELGRWLREA